MYEVNIMVYGPKGEDLGYKRYCSNDELEKLLRTCDSSKIALEQHSIKIIQIQILLDKLCLL